MKKQINPTIKAHLIRGAFYLLLLIAVCAIPFALAQRNTTKGSTAKSKTGSAMKFAAAPAANGPAQATRLAGVHSKAPSQAKAPSQSKDASRLRANDAPAGPNLPRIALRPQKSAGVRATHVIPLLPPPKAPQVVLYDQYDNAGANATFSGTFTDFTGFDADLADDFVVPGGQTWIIRQDSADSDEDTVRCRT